MSPPASVAVVRALDRGLAAMVRMARWLALPLAVLLFLQWPLREWIQAFSREANDLAQVVFAFYVAVAMTAATRANAHLSVAAPKDRRSFAARAAAALVVLPATVGLAVVAVGPIWRSVRALEAFPETYNPGYFALKVALGLLTLAALVQALVDVVALRDAR